MGNSHEMKWGEICEDGEKLSTIFNFEWTLASIGSQGCRAAKADVFMLSCGNQEMCDMVIWQIDSEEQWREEKEIEVNIDECGEDYCTWACILISF